MPDELDARDALARAVAARRLAAGVAHDFNNALTSISAYAHLALSRLEPQDPVHADIRQIVRAVEHAARLVTELQAFSRGRQAERATVDVNQCVRDVGRLLAVVLGEQIELELRLANRLPSIEANVGAVEQAIMQLALNARDAMPDGGRLTIETRVASAPGDRAQLQRHRARGWTTRRAAGRWSRSSPPRPVRIRSGSGSPPSTRSSSVSAGSSS